MQEYKKTADNFEPEDWIGETFIIPEYLDDNMLRLNYIYMVEAIYDKMEEILDTDMGQLPQDILKDIMSNDPKNLVDYYKLKNSIQNFYMPLKTKLKSIPGYDSKQFIKKMNYLNAVLNDIKDRDYKLENEELTDVEDKQKRKRKTKNKTMKRKRKSITWDD